MKERVKEYVERETEVGDGRKWRKHSSYYAPS